MRRIDEASFIRLFFSYVYLQARQRAVISLTGAEVGELIELGEVFESDSVLDRREHHRLKLATPVRLKQGGSVQRCITVDISGGGLRLACCTPPALGTRVVATLVAGDTDHIFTGEVVRHTGDGCALRFVGVPLEVHHGKRRGTQPALNAVSPPPVPGA